MKRYWLFSGATYYPAGGMQDLVGSYESLNDCTAALDKMDEWSTSWWHVYDSELNRIALASDGNDFLLKLSFT